MKCNHLFGSMLLIVACVVPSFGFDLLDRMLGSHGCGCDVSCCEVTSNCKPTPTCGAEPACGVEPTCCLKACHPSLLKNLVASLKTHRCRTSCSVPCEPTCAAPSASCGAEPACGTEPACGCEPRAARCCKTGLLNRIFRSPCGKNKSCCQSEPGCGIEPTCGIEPDCSGNGTAPATSAPTPAPEPAPMPTKAAGLLNAPAPVIDPSV